MGNSAFFRGKLQIPRQTANSAARRENPRAAEYCWPDYNVSVAYSHNHTVMSDNVCYGCTHVRPDKSNTDCFHTVEESSSCMGTHLRTTGHHCCHMGSHSVTCHPTQVNAPRLKPDQPGIHALPTPMDGRLI